MLFNNLNEKATIENAKDMLNDYRVYHQLAKKVELPTLQSPIISDMPKSKPDGNSQENKVIDYMMRQEFAKYYCTLVDNTLEAIEDDTKRMIIYECYINCKYSNGYLVDKVGYSEVRYHQIKNDALLTFAEVCPGRPNVNKEGEWVFEELVVHQSLV